MLFASKLIKSSDVFSVIISKTYKWLAALRTKTDQDGSLQTEIRKLCNRK